MPRARHSDYFFTAVCVRQNAPSWIGSDDLLNAHAWIYIQAVDGIRAALLAHLNERDPRPSFRSVNRFTVEHDPDAAGD